MAPRTLKGRMPSNAATIDLDLSALPNDQLHWPEFHNGTAAALRLCPPGCGPTDEGELGRNWIVYNKPRSRQHSHAGFLLGLGLQGHLLALAHTDLYRYMSQGHDVTMMAVLLGMAAARRGSMHNAIAKMLCLHIPSLHPPTFTELGQPLQTVYACVALLVGEMTGLILELRVRAQLQAHAQSCGRIAACRLSRRQYGRAER